MLNTKLQNHLPKGHIIQTNSSDTYRFGLSSGSDGYMYVDNVNLSTDEITRLQFCKNGRLQLLTINGDVHDYKGTFLSSANIKWGSMKFTGLTQGTTKSQQLLFTEAFPSVPRIFLSVSTTNPKTAHASTMDTTVSGTTIYAVRDDTQDVLNVFWLAIAI